MPRQYTPRVPVNCAHCGTLILAWPSKLARGQSKYCSRACRFASYGTLEERFWSKVDTSGECWTWLGSRNAGDYGWFEYQNRMHLAHRIAWMLTHGELPGLFVCHTCDNPPCVRPDHLFLGDASANMSDMTRKGRHPYRTGDEHYTRQRPEVLRRGEAHQNAIITDEIVRAIRLGHERGISQQSLADHFGIHQTTVSRIIRRTAWRHVV